MPRNPPVQTSDPADHKPEREREPERGGERSVGAHKRRDDDDDDDGRTVEPASAARDAGTGKKGDHDGAQPPPSAPGLDDDEEALTEADVMEVLDLDDLQKMEGPDA
jgi:hypothetical protein